MDATRLAAVCAKIDEYAARGAPMSGNKIAAICAMIDDGATARKHGRNRRRRRRRLCVDSTRSYKQIGEFRRPNLVGLHAVARDPRTKEYSVVMEYADGPSLRHALKEHLRAAPFPEADVRRVMRQLLTGAEAMHSRRIIHRDIKTGNFIVNEDGSAVKICDCLRAGAVSTAANPGGHACPRAGTVAYMAPEVLKYRSDYDERVDLWSIGCVMAELLSGKGVVQGDVGDIIFMSPFMASKVLRRRARQPRPRRDSRLREIFASDVLSQDGYDVLKGLLTCNPKERLTAATALQLPWFTAGTVGVPASEVGATESTTQTALLIVLVVTSVWAFLRKMALPLIKLPHQLFLR
ncbi:LOW QUALITY PROTEIN: hypothetical protein SORBI_3002G219600 [Sorghum bicolor]|uniref:[RNA-polymerase]-subunit kinase n=1 Tax=Sorghum bicolor TaxID=4558 RepID=A0A1W0W5C7_SORBI|nr:LOW QUALITY PROTEIN: hypothetical protein SORBI_3002G219600 [Sorghum bicolor]